MDLSRQQIEEVVDAVTAVFGIGPIEKGLFEQACEAAVKALRPARFKAMNRIELDALGTALTQYIENTEDVEDELGPNDQKELKAVRTMLERVELEQVKGL